VIKACIILLGLLLAAVAAGNARPPPNPDQSLAPWYQSLRTSNGLSCCGEADCRGPKDYPVRIVDGHYEVWADQRWMTVPPEAVSDRTDNPTGDFVTCVQESYWESGTRMPKVLCLFKASGL